MRERLLTGAAVRTLDPDHPHARAVLVRGERIAAVLDDPADAPGVSEQVELAGCLLPGFTDAHVHLLSWAASREELRLEGATSLDAALARVRDGLGDVRRRGWLRGFGWSAERWDAPPDRAALDAVTGDVPTALLAHDWHSLWLNSAGLALAGELEVPGGVVERDADGAPTGLLREESAWRVRDGVAAPSAAERLDALRTALPAAPAAGVTAVHDKDGRLGCPDVVAALRAEGAVPIRVWHSLPAAALGELVAAGVEPGAGDAWQRTGYLKAYMDGTLGSGTARLLDRGGAGDERSEAGGVVITGRDEFAAIVRAAGEAGWPVAVHAIGDRAVRDALDGFEAARDAWAPRGLRPRIEHAQCVSPEDLPRFAALGVTASVQPSMAVTDQAVAEREWAERLDGAYAYRSLQAAGARLVGGSDAPIEPLDPLDGIRAAVLRTRGDAPPWRPQEAVDLDTALAMWTSGPAWLEGAEAERGRIAPGRLADLTWLDRDPADDLLGARVLATMAGGAFTFGAP